MQTISSINPYDNSVVGEVEVSNTDEIKRIISVSKEAQKKWKCIPLLQRVEQLEKVYVFFQSQSQKLAYSISQEMGMPINQAIEEVKYGFMYWDWYLKNASTYLSEEITYESEKELHKVLYEPKGLVAAIAPWNYPFSMFVWTSIQALLAGNSVIFKTSKDTIITGQLIEDLWIESGIISGIFQQIYGDGSVGDILVTQDINFITFTGSTKVGKHLYQLAAEKFIGCVMELGGSAPGIIMEDANLDSVLESIYFFRYSNCGQMCDGLKRLIVHESRYDETIERLKHLLESKKIGNPLNTSTDIGPLVNEAQLIHLEKQVQDALDKGAVILSELIPDSSLQGNFHSAMILGNISLDMDVWREEVFGPVLPVVTFSTFEEMIQLANDTNYGLGAYVFTSDVHTFERVAKDLQTGEVQHNTINYCIGPNPFGGYKDSGIGREHGHWGFREFCNVKVVSIEK